MLVGTRVFEKWVSGMTTDKLLETIKANPAQFVGVLGSSIRKFLTDEIGPPEKWWISYSN
jgi:hypothetical protein